MFPTPVFGLYEQMANGDYSRVGLYSREDVHSLIARARAMLGEGQKPVLLHFCFAADARPFFEAGVVADDSAVLSDTNGYAVEGPDCLFTERDPFKGFSDALISMEQFAKRYERQGYYSTCDGVRIPVNEIKNWLRLIDLGEPDSESE